MEDGYFTAYGKAPGFFVSFNKFLFCSENAILSSTYFSIATPLNGRSEDYNDSIICLFKDSRKSSKFNWNYFRWKPCGLIRRCR